MENMEKEPKIIPIEEGRTDLSGEKELIENPQAVINEALEEIGQQMEEDTRAEELKNRNEE